MSTNQNKNIFKRTYGNKIRLFDKILGLQWWRKWGTITLICHSYNRLNELKENVSGNREAKCFFAFQ
jgi:hypothetical protein